MEPSFESNEVVKWKSVEDELHSIEKPLNQSDQDNILWKKVPFPYKKLTTKYHFETISLVGAEKNIRICIWPNTKGKYRMGKI